MVERRARRLIDRWQEQAILTWRQTRRTRAGALGEITALGKFEVCVWFWNGMLGCTEIE